MWLVVFKWCLGIRIGACLVKARILCNVSTCRTVFRYVVFLTVGINCILQVPYQLLGTIARQRGNGIDRAFPFIGFEETFFNILRICNHIELVQNEPARFFIKCFVIESQLFDNRARFTHSAVHCIGIMYDRTNGAVKAITDLETFSGTYSAAVADGIKGEGGNALAVRVDVSDPESAKEMAAQDGWTVK